MDKGFVVARCLPSGHMDLLIMLWNDLQAASTVVGSRQTPLDLQCPFVFCFLCDVKVQTEVPRFSSVVTYLAHLAWDMRLHFLAYICVAHACSIP